MAGADGGGSDHDVGLANVVAAVPESDTSARALERVRHRRRGQVGTADRVAPLQVEMSQGAHTRTADTYKVRFYGHGPHAAAWTTRRATSAAASGRPNARLASAIRARRPGSALSRRTSSTSRTPLNSSSGTTTAAPARSTGSALNRWWPPA